MNIDIIHNDFVEMLHKKDVYIQLGRPDVYVRVLRYKVKKGIRISTDLKLKLLQKSGWKQSQAIYSRKDLLDAVKMTLKSSKHARELGAEYIVDKFISKKLIIK